MNVRCTMCSLVTLLCLSQGLEAQQCNLNSIRGNWAFSGKGWAIPFGVAPERGEPVTFLGVLTLDGSGKVTGSMTLISGFPIPGTAIPAGAVLDMEFVDSTLDVNTDCTGVLRSWVKIKGFPQAVGPYVDRVVVLPDKGEMIAMAVRSPISYPIWTWTARKMTGNPTPVLWPDVN